VLRGLLTGTGVTLTAVILGGFAGCGDDAGDDSSGTTTSPLTTVDARDFERCMDDGRFELRSGADYFTDAEGHSPEAGTLRDGASDVLVATDVEVRYRKRSPILKDPDPEALVLIFDTPEAAAAVVDMAPGDFVARSSRNLAWIFGGSSLLPVEVTDDMRAFSAAAIECTEPAR